MTDCGAGGWKPSRAFLAEVARIRRLYPWLSELEPDSRPVPVREGWAQCPGCGHRQWALTPRPCVQCGAEVE